MTVKQVTLTLDTQMYEKATAKAARQGYKNVQQYANDLLHHAVYSKKHRGGRPLKEGFDDSIARMIARPTKESKKRVATARRSGLWR